jgi:hypothetical protein
MINNKIKEIRSFCMNNSNPEIIKKYSKYFKEGYDGYGIEQKAFENQRDKWIVDWKERTTHQPHSTGLVNGLIMEFQTGQLQMYCVCLYFQVFLLTK